MVADEIERLLKLADRERARAEHWKVRHAGRQMFIEALEAELRRIKDIAGLR